MQGIPCAGAKRGAAHQLNLGAHVRQQHRAERAGTHTCNLYDTDACQRALCARAIYALQT